MSMTEQPIMTFGEIQQALNESLAELNGNESLSRVCGFAEQTREQYETLIQTDSLAAETDAVYSDLYERTKALFTSSVDAVTQGITELKNGDATNQQQSTVTEVSTGSTITGGQSAFSDFLTSEQPVMSRSNTSATDASALSELAYAGKFSKKKEYIAAAGRDGITIGEYCDGLLKAGGSDLSDVERTFLEQMKDSDRYSSLVIDHAVGRTYSAETLKDNISSATGDLEADASQIAVSDSSGINAQMLIINTGDGNAFVAIEGTNGMTDDWAKGNGDMAGSGATDEEEWYAAYLRNHLDEYDSFTAAGHSQGGHEAVTAVILQGKNGIDKCDAVYNMDGPNYSTGYMETYAEEIDAIKGKVHHYKATFISDLFGREIGENIEVSTVDVEENGETHWLDKHLGTHWPLQRNEDGSYSLVQEKRGILESLTGDVVSGLTGKLTDHLTLIMGEEKTLEFAEGLMQLFDDNGRMNFSLDTLLNKKENVGEFLLETYEAYEAAYRQYAQNNLSDEDAAVLIVAHYVKEFTSVANVALDAAQLLCASVSWIPYIGEGFAAVAAGMKTLQSTLKIVGFAAKVLVAYYEKKAREEYERKKAERQAYVASNPELKYNLDEIDVAAEMIGKASEYAQEAYEAYNAMLKYFKETIIEKILDEFGIEQTKTRIEYLTTFSAGVLCKSKGASLSTDVYDQYTKVTSALDTIVNSGLSILNSIGLAADRITTVNPTKLSSEAYSAEAWYADIIKKIEQIGTEVGMLGNAWQGQDYESIKAAGSILEEEMKARASCVVADLNTVQKAAALYGQFQNTTIELFQNIKV